jgi:hypothetical protein
MKNHRQKLLYADTNSLIFAYEKHDFAWRSMLEDYFANGYTLALAEENLIEFAQSPTTEDAVNLAQRVVDLKPVWLRSFADIQADEVIAFAENHDEGELIHPPEIYRQTFESVSQVGGNHTLDPISFVKAFSSTKAKAEVRVLRDEHAGILNTLTGAKASGTLAKGHLLAAFRQALAMRLLRGSDFTPPLSASRVEEAVGFCIKHRKWLLSKCPSFAAEYHLANYRCQSPKRKARLSDSVDLTTTVAALPYVDIFVTNDGFLYAGLEDIKRQLPSIKTVLMRRPNAV